MKTRALLMLALTVSMLCPSVSAAKEPTTQGEVSYVTGGVGTEERDQLEAMSGRFNLKLTHAHPNGEYVSNVHVRISNAQGQVMLDAVTNGPLFYAQLPPGAYTVICTFSGKEQKQSVQVVSGKQAQLKLIWPDA